MCSYETVRRQIIEACLSLSDKGWLSGTGGNVSMRIPGEAAMAITPSNMDYRAMTVDDVCVVDWSLSPLAGERKPSVESGMHAGVYQARQDVGAVVHTHQPYASAVALLARPIPALFDEQARFLGRSVEIIPYAISGTGWLKGNVMRQIKSGNNAYILENHGALCFGPTLARAAFNVELLEKCAITYLLALCTGEKVHRLNPAIRELILTRLRADEKRAAETFARGEMIDEGQHSY